MGTEEDRRVDLAGMVELSPHFKQQWCYVERRLQLGDYQMPYLVENIMMN